MKRIVAVISVVVCAGFGTSALGGETWRLYVMAGQSNMVGRGENSQLPPFLQQPRSDVRVHQWGQWNDLGPGHGFIPEMFGPELSFGWTMADARPGERIGLIKVAVDWTGLAGPWQPGGVEPPGYMYQRMLDEVAAARASLPAEDVGVISGFAWMQGEWDASYAEPAIAYEENLTEFIASVRADFGDTDLPFAYGRITGDGLYPFESIVREAQRRVAQQVPGTVMVDTDDLIHGGGHYLTDGTLKLGTRLAEGILSVPEPATGVMVLLLAGCMRWRA